MYMLDFMHCQQPFSACFTTESGLNRENVLHATPGLASKA
jgi:hypothetical protein